MIGRVAAVDVGGTTIKAALVDDTGVAAEERSLRTDTAGGPAAVVRQIRELASALSALPGVAAIGLAVPGTVDVRTGTAVFSANLGWRDVPLRALVAGDTGLPVALGHDVGAAGLADAEFGATAGTDDSLLVVIGTGIAGVVRAHGRVVTGNRGLAGELGHLSVYPDGEACPCGQRGCLERYASAAAISRAYASGGGPAAASAADVAAARLADAAAGRAWDRATEALGIVLASATMLLDPAVIAFAGGLAEAGSALLDPVHEVIARRVAWRPVPALKLSPLGARAGLLGAALLARGVLGWHPTPGTREVQR